MILYLNIYESIISLLSKDILLSNVSSFSFININLLFSNLKKYILDFLSFLVFLLAHIIKNVVRKLFSFRELLSLLEFSISISFLILSQI